jgi:hypothetical protein
MISSGSEVRDLGKYDASSLFRCGREESRGIVPRRFIASVPIPEREKRA